MDDADDDNNNNDNNNNNRPCTLTSDSATVKAQNTPHVI